MPTEIPCGFPGCTFVASNESEEIAKLLFDAHAVAHPSPSAQTASPVAPKRRGRCFLINNHFFPENIKHLLGLRPDQEPNLVGYKDDALRIRQTFENLKFEVIEKTNCSGKEIQGHIEEWCANDFTDDDCVIIFVLSHGGEQGIVFGCDAGQVSIEDDIVNRFSNCHTLQGKPKFYMIQACRGVIVPEATKIENQRPKSSKIYQPAAVALKKERNRETFVYYSTAEGSIKLFLDSYEKLMQL